MDVLPGAAGKGPKQIDREVPGMLTNSFARKLLKDFVLPASKEDTKRFSVM
jgi:hypothetical protein